MWDQLTDYTIFPLVYPSGEKSTVKIAPRARHARLKDAKEYAAVFCPLDETLEGTDRTYDVVFVFPQEGALTLEYTFGIEQEYHIRIYEKEIYEQYRTSAAQDPFMDGLKDGHTLALLRVYCLKPDLYALRPYRGDFHVHTVESDGQQSADLVAAAYRGAGYDFMTITDHERYYPSLLCQEWYSGVPTSLRIYPGEEVQTPGNHVHLIHFGGNRSVNEYWQEDPERYRQQVEAIRATLEETPGVNSFEEAACLWSFEKIRTYGGLSIYCHPHWIPLVRHVSEAFTQKLFATVPFDAFEVLGGNGCADNNTQTALYNEHRAGGGILPIVGSSDAHSVAPGSPNFMEESTTIFSPDDTLDSIMCAVRHLYSVAVERYHGEQPRVYGPYRLVKYTIFLNDCYFPGHDALCHEEGRLMLPAANGDLDALERLKSVTGLADSYRTACFACSREG